MNNRRKFLKDISLGALATPVASAGFGAMQKSRVSRLRVGVLAPRSSVVPRLEQSLEQGFKLFFNEKESPKIDLLKEGIGSGGVNETTDRANRLLSEDVDLVIGVVNPIVTAALKPIFEEKQKIFIELSMGERIPSLKDASEYIFHHSLHLWQASFASGRWAAQQHGKKAVICTSLYDSGYDTVYAFRCGFEKEGGEIAGTYVLNELTGMPDLVETIGQAQPSVVFGLFSGKSASSFFFEFQRKGLAGKIPLVASRFLVSGDQLQVFGEKAVGITHVFPWSVSMATPENKTFVEGFEKMNGGEPNEFALLGYEAAQWIDQALQQNIVGNDNWNTKDMAHALQMSSFNSPRGTVTVNAQNATESGLFLQEVAQSGKRVSHRIVQKLPDTLGECEECLRETLEEVRSGWMNPYLAV